MGNQSSTNRSIDDPKKKSNKKYKKIQKIQKKKQQKIQKNKNKERDLASCRVAFETIFFETVVVDPVVFSSSGVFVGWFLVWSDVNHCK